MNYLIDRDKIKRFLLLQIFIGIFITHLEVIHAQDVPFTVIKAIGVAYSEALHKNLQSGDKVSGSDKIRFGGLNDYLVLISPKDGRKLVKPNLQNTVSELNSLITEFVSLERKNTAFRSIDDPLKSEGISRVKKQFSVDTLLILGSGKASFSVSDIILNDTAKIRAIFYDGQVNQERTVSYGNVLDLSKASIFDQSPPAKVQLIYYGNVSKGIFEGTLELLGSFMPRYLINEDSLKSEVQIIKNNSLNQAERDFVVQVQKYIEEEYGAFINENLIQWLSDNHLK